MTTETTGGSASTPPTRLRYGGIASLAAIGFVYFTAETLPVGLLPQIAEGLHVSQAQVGLLVTLYAAFAAAGAIPLTSLTLRVPRHLLVLALVIAYVVSQVGAALAPTFALLVAARLLTALAHGVFWSVMAPVAIRLAPPGQGGKASALAVAGTTAGMVLGVPLSTILGQAVGWRQAYGVLAIAGALAAVGVALFLPKLPASPAQAASTLRGQFGAAWRLVRSKPITIICATMTLTAIGQYAVYTYTAPVVDRTGGISGAALSALLLGYGAMGLIANVVVGRIVDRHPGAAILGCLVCTGAALVALSVTSSTVVTIVAVLIWGAGYACVPLVIQLTALRVSPGARDSASAIRQTASQIGISGGSLVGGLIFGLGGLVWLAPFGAVMMAVFIGVVLANRELFPLTTDPEAAPRTGEIGIVKA